MPDESDMSQEETEELEFPVWVDLRHVSARALLAELGRRAPPGTTTTGRSYA